MAFSKARRLANLMSSASDTVPAAKVVIADDAIGVDQLANSINTNINNNNDKLTNATHTGDVTGSGALTIAVDAVDIPMLSASGTANNTTFLRGDNAWASVPAGVDIQSSAPSVASEGSLYYNSTTDKLYLSNGTAWVQVSTNSEPLALGGTITIPAQAGLSSFSYNLGLGFTDADNSDDQLTYTLESGTLPAGAVLPTTGNTALTGTATNQATATYNFVIKATDANGAFSNQAYTQVITNLPALAVEVLVVAGGGSGASGRGNGTGGGGAGGLQTFTYSWAIPSKAIVIGAGGTGLPAPASGQQTQGNDGANSSAFGTTSIGGGGGATNNSGIAGRVGGSGGGGGAYGAAGGAGTSGQGNAGGTGTGSGDTKYRGGGGGGKGGVGASGSASGAGGIGWNVAPTMAPTGHNWATYTSTGSSQKYAGGGGGGQYTYNSGGGGTGGAGGGGNGGREGAQNGYAGVANTGSGGGGGGSRSTGGAGGAGGSGIVIIRYAGGTVATGGTITNTGGATYHVFTASGTITRN